MVKQKLKVGILLDDFTVPAWINKLLTLISESDEAEIKLVIKNAAYLPEETLPKYSAYNFYRKFEKRFVKVKPDAFAPKDATSLFNGLPIIDVKPVQKDEAWYFGENEIETIKSYHLDVIIKLGFKKLQGDILQGAKSGIWAYDHSVNDLKDVSATGVWEVMKQSADTGISLKLLRPDNKQDFILYHSWSATNNSIRRNRNISFWKSVLFIPRKLKELAAKGPVAFMDEIEKNNQQGIINNHHTIPANKEFIPYLIHHFRTKLEKKLSKAFSNEQWILMYQFHKNSSEIVGELSTYKSLVPPKDRFWADPHVFKTDDDKYFIFIEEQAYKKKKAHISVLEIDKTGVASQPKIVLEKPYHLSYPHVFRDGNDIYMLPETSANNAIELYKCVSFPDKWEFRMNLMENVHAVDATIHFYSNKYWMFVNIKEIEGSSAWDELFIFYSDTLLSNQWIPHIKNPVISDVKYARPAGNLFTCNDRLFRPSQDCSVSYGYATNINEIIVLDENEYIEKPVTKILPGWQKKIVGTHTFSRVDDLTVIDVRQIARK